MTDVTLDTGALIRLQRDRTLLRELLSLAHHESVHLVTPAPALTEFLGGSSRQHRPAADWVGSHLQVGTVDAEAARRGAALIRGAKDAAPSSSPSAIDALVAAQAEQLSGTVAIAGDRSDFDALATASGQLKIVDLEALIR